MQINSGANSVALHLHRLFAMLNEKNMKSGIQIFVLFLVLLASSISNAEIMKVLVEKEIDDDHIIIVTAKGDRLILEKWTMKLSPLLFEGKIFFADVSSMWVKIYIEGKSEIKWSVEKNLDTISLDKPQQSIYNAKETYLGVGSGHWIQTVSSGGKYITLEDRSIWEVSPIDVIYSAIWLPITNIVVIEESGPYPYKLVNTDDREAVNAKYLGQ